jgi:hypothetical protein
VQLGEKTDDAVLKTRLKAAQALKTASAPPVRLDSAKQTLPVRLGLVTRPKKTTPAWLGQTTEDAVSKTGLKAAQVLMAATAPPVRLGKAKQGATKKQGPQNKTKKEMLNPGDSGKYV